MLTEKDYCDYDTCVALREVGCRIQTEWYIHQPSYERGACYLCFGIPQETSVLDNCDYIPRLSLYEAQKWLREEKGLYVEIEIFEYTYNYRILDTKNVYYDNEHVVRDNGCLVGSYEDALLEGIKKAVKILKKNETIHR